MMKCYNKVLSGIDVVPEEIDLRLSLGVVFESDDGRRIKISEDVNGVIRVDTPDGKLQITPIVTNAIYVEAIRRKGLIQ